MALIAPLDLESLFVNTLSGSWFIFVALALIVIAGLSAKFRMNGYAFGMMVGLFAIVMFTFAPWFLVFLTVIGGVLIYYTVAKLGK
jgi:hypothetical protein